MHLLNNPAWLEQHVTASNGSCLAFHFKQLQQVYFTTASNDYHTAYTLKCFTHNTAYSTLKRSTIETQPSASSHLSPTISQTLSRAPLLFLDQPAFQTPSSPCSLQSSIRTAPQCLSLLQGRWWSERPARESSTLRTRKVSG